MFNQKSWQPLIIIGGGILLFAGVVILLFSSVSKTDEATEKLIECKSYNDVYTIWKEYQDDLKDDATWKLNVIEKLNNKDFPPLTSVQQNEAHNWLGLPTALNLIIVPDLSSRIKIDGQVKTDKKLLNYLWFCFDAHVRSQVNSGDLVQVKNRIIVDVTSEIQEKMQSSLPNLLIDLANKGDASLTTLKNKQADFSRYIDEIYAVAGPKTKGANYVEYINSSLKTNHRKSTWYDKVDNVLIITTDGYVELSGGPDDNTITRFTGNDSQRDKAAQAMERMSLSQALLQNGIQIPVDRNVDLKEWRILVLEARHRGQRYNDFKIMKQAWADWLKAENCQIDEASFFQPHEPQIQKVYDAISNFLKVTPNSTVSGGLPDPVEPVTITTVNESDAYDKLVTEADQAIQSNDFKQGKLLLQKAAQIRETANISISAKAETIYQKYVRFADDARQTFLDTKTEGLDDIPARYYELAMLIKPSTDVRRKLAASTNP